MRNAWSLTAWIVIACMLIAGCGTTAVPAMNEHDGDVAVPDGELSEPESGAPLDASADAVPLAEAGVDGSSTDATTQDASFADSASEPDATLDAGKSDGASSDAPLADGAADAGGPPPDAAGEDAPLGDASATDAASDATLGPDAGDATVPADAMTDALVDAVWDAKSDGAPDGAADSGTDTGVDAPAVLLQVSPATATLDVTLGSGAAIPTQQFTATLGGASASVAWSAAAGQVGTISPTGLFTPAAGSTSTAVGGTTMVTAAAFGQTATATVTVNITQVATYVTPSDAGVDSAGGYGGVGGDGVGDAASDAQVAALNGTPNPDSGITLLYPYDKTVFPQGILAPLLQWNDGTHTGAGAIVAMRLTLTEASYSYTGYFTIQPGVTDFKNQIIPQSVWDTLTYTNGGDPVRVSLVFLDAEGALWGPVTESWIIAPGSLAGTIYYNSYGTNLVKNYSTTVGGVTYTFGGATLGIRPGATGPSLVAGTSSACRVCHTVSANGSALFTEQGGNYSETSAYTLSPDAAVESVPAVDNGSGLLAWPALYPDGTMLFSNSGGLAGASTAASALYAGLSDGTTPAGTLIPTTGLNGIGGLTPAFSPNGGQIAFNYYLGQLPDAGAADRKSLAVLNMNALDAGADAAPTAPRFAFSGGRVLWTPDSGVGAYFPSYYPDGTELVVELQTQSNGRDLAGTRASTDSNDTNTLDGAHGELWIVNVATGQATRLDRANGFDTDAGIAYLPAHAAFATNPAGDIQVNYEPTVSPYASGGYAWVIFTSRRMYGNVATVNPFWSDERYEPQILTTPTPKKLWVAAVDLHPTPGKDPSHPAFYLPGQELLAGNSRGYWVANPCEGNGTTCATGSQCCSGYCADTDDAGILECMAPPPPCATAGEACGGATVCCPGTPTLYCNEGLCAVPQ